MSDEHTHDWLNERELEDDRPSRSELAEVEDDAAEDRFERWQGGDDQSWRDEDPEEPDEVTLKVNVGFVGDLRSALEGIGAERALHLVAAFPSGPEAVIDEIRILSDGRIGIFIS